MLGQKDRDQPELFVAGSLRALLPDDHILVRVDRVLDLSWLRAEVSDCYSSDKGRPGIGPEAAVAPDACRVSSWHRPRPALDARSASEFGDPLVHRLRPP